MRLDSMAEPSYLTQAEVDEAAFTFVTEGKKHLQTQRRNAGYENLWIAEEESYHSKTSSYYDGKAQVKDAVNFKMVERLVPKIKKLIFPPDEDWFDVQAENEEDAIAKEHAIQAKSLLQEQFNDINIKTRYTKQIRSMATYGTVWGKSLWEHRVRETFERDSKNKRVPKFTVEYDNPTVYSPSIWDIFVDIRDEDLKGILIEQINKDYQVLWDNRERKLPDGTYTGIYRNVESLREVKAPKVQDSNKQASENLRGLSDHSFGEHEQKIRVMECWGPIPQWFLTRSVADKEQGLYMEGLIVVAVSGEEAGSAAGKTIRISDNPLDHQQKPYDRARCIAFEGSVYGMSAIAHNLTMEKGINTILNQALDTHTFNLRPKWLLDEGAEIDPSSLKDLDEQIILTQDVNGLQALRPNDFTGTALALVGFFRNASEEVSGATNIVGGQAAGSSIERTSIGVATTTGNALDRFELMAENFVDEMIRPQCRKIWGLNQQFLPKGRSIKIIGKDFARVKPRDIALPSINFTSISNQIQKELRINQANILLQNISGLVPMGFDPVPIAIEQLKLMGWGYIIPLVDKRPDSDEKLEESPEGEEILLRMGKQVRINFEDDHDAYMAVYERMLQEPGLASNVKANTKKAMGERIVAKATKRNPDAFANIIGSGSKNERTS